MMFVRPYYRPGSIRSKIQFGFKKSFSTSVVIGGFFDKIVSCGTLLTDMSKDFDGIVHDFLKSKLEAYGFII